MLMSVAVEREYLLTAMSLQFLSGGRGAQQSYPQDAWKELWMKQHLSYGREHFT